MKINIEVQVEDLISDMQEDGECDIESELKSVIIRSVIQKLLPKIQESVDKKIEQRLDAIFIERVNSAVEKTLNKAIDNGVLVKRGVEVSIHDHITSLFQQASGWNSPNDKIQKIAKEFGKELKDQYNVIFASKIVENIKEQGLLKDDVAKLLLGDK